MTDEDESNEDDFDYYDERVCSYPCHVCGEEYEDDFEELEEEGNDLER